MIVSQFTFSMLKPGFLADMIKCCMFVLDDPHSEGDVEGLAKPQSADDTFVVLMASSPNMRQSYVYATYLLS